MKKIINRLMLIFVTTTIATIISLTFFSNRLRVTILQLAVSETGNVASKVLNEAVQEYVTGSSNQLLYEQSRNESSLLVNFSTPALNLMNSLIATKTQQKLIEISNGSDCVISKCKNGIIEQIPLSMAFNNPALSWLGPTMPVRFKLIGDVINTMSAKVTNYGINNVLIEVVSDIKIRVMVLIPSISELTKIDFPVTLAMMLVQGEVPLYYQGSYDIKSGGLAIPLQ